MHLLGLFTPLVPSPSARLQEALWLFPANVLNPDLRLCGPIYLEPPGNASWAHQLSIPVFRKRLKTILSVSANAQATQSTLYSDVNNG